MKPRSVQHAGHRKRIALRERLLALLVLFGILFGGIVTPAIAHVRGADLGHVGEILDLDEVAQTTPHDDAGAALDMSGQAALHHHCTLALRAVGPALSPVTPASGILPAPAISHFLASFTEAPPTEPPAA